MSRVTSPSQLDRLLPGWDFRERHRIWIPASPSAALDALRHVTAAELRLTELLVWIRFTVARLLTPRARRRPRPGSATVLAAMLRSGFTLLAERPGQEIVIGFVGQPWTPGAGERRPIADAAAFTAFAEPGFVKVVTNLEANALAGRTELATETRILATDDRARRRFGLYWRLIQPGSALIRLDLLHAIARRAG